MKIHYTTQFKKDHKKINKQKKDLLKLRAVIEKLITDQSLDPKHKDHQLSGNWTGHRDCHIEPDWILIYRITADDLYLERTGSHSDLFKKQNLSFRQKVSGRGDVFHLRESVVAYNVDSGTKNNVIEPQNAYFWNKDEVIAIR